MGNIGGNTTVVFQTNTTVKNVIGEAIKAWVDACTFTGWLDLQSGDSRYTTYNAKVEESSHIFVCDFSAEVYALSGSDARAIIKGFVYDVLFIDNPMELNEQLEIHLRRVGSWDGR